MTAQESQKDASAAPKESNAPPNDLEKASTSGDTKQAAVEEQRDPNVVDWDGPDDRDNPQYARLSTSACNP